MLTPARAEQQRKKQWYKQPTHNKLNTEGPITGESRLRQRLDVPRREVQKRWREKSGARSKEARRNSLSKSTENDGSGNRNT